MLWVGECTPESISQVMFTRIAKLQPELKFMTSMAARSALLKAEAMIVRREDSPLKGVPYTIKDTRYCDSDLFPTDGLLRFAGTCV